jgi:hypothetical protein
MGCSEVKSLIQTIKKRLISRAIIQNDKEKSMEQTWTRYMF